MLQKRSFCIHLTLSYHKTRKCYIKQEYQASGLLFPLHTSTNTCVCLHTFCYLCPDCSDDWNSWFRLAQGSALPLLFSSEKRSFVKVSSQFSFLEVQKQIDSSSGLQQSAFLLQENLKGNTEGSKQFPLTGFQNKQFACDKTFIMNLYNSQKQTV